MRVNRENRNCPYCLSPIAEHEERVRCPKCGVVHHAECWRTNGQCSVYGCDGWAQWNADIAEKISPAEPEAVEIADTRPRSKREPETARCIECGATVHANQMLCGNCRRRQPSERWQNCAGPSVLLVGGVVWLICLTVRALI